MGKGGYPTQSINTKDNIMPKNVHGKTSDMLLHSGIRGAKTGAAAKTNEKATGLVSLGIKGAVPAATPVVDHTAFQHALKVGLPAALHFFATNYPHLVPAAIGSHRLVVGASLMVEAEGRDVFEEIAEQLFAVLSPVMKMVADLAPAEGSESQDDDGSLTVVASEVVASAAG
jgi:hypothetical protein